MVFLRLYCKKEKLLPFTACLLLSSFGVLLTNSLEVQTSWIKQPYTRYITKTDRFYPQNKYDSSPVTITANKKLITLPTNYISPISTFQSVFIFSIFLITTIVICIRFCNFQIQYFLNKRAPPLA